MNGCVCMHAHVCVCVYRQLHSLSGDLDELLNDVGPLVQVFLQTDHCDDPRIHLTNAMQSTPHVINYTRKAIHT